MTLDEAVKRASSLTPLEQQLVEALRDLVADSDDVDDGRLPQVSATSLARARQALTAASEIERERAK